MLSWNCILVEKRNIFMIFLPPISFLYFLILYILTLPDTQATQVSVQEARWFILVVSRGREMSHHWTTGRLASLIQIKIKTWIIYTFASMVQFTPFSLELGESKSCWCLCSLYVNHLLRLGNSFIKEMGVNLYSTNEGEDLGIEPYVVFFFFFWVVNKGYPS